MLKVVHHVCQGPAESNWIDYEQLLRATYVRHSAVLIKHSRLLAMLEKPGKLQWLFVPPMHLEDMTIPDTTGSTSFFPKAVGTRGNSSYQLERLRHQVAFNVLAGKLLQKPHHAKVTNSTNRENFVLIGSI